MTLGGPERTNGKGVQPLVPAIDPEVFGRPAHSWHSKRRVALLKHPGVRMLLRDGAGRAWNELGITLFVAALVLMLHAAVAIGLREFAQTASTPTSIFVAFILAATVGGLCAFALQALNHELSHAVLWVGHASVGSAERWLAWVFGLAICASGASLCHVPWAAYYFGGGHGRHHRWAGSQMDVDGDALFYLWNPPLTGVVGRFTWISVAAAMVPVAYIASLISFAIVHPAANISEIRLILLHICMSIKACYVVGRTGAFYLWLSSCFSMGMFLHPLAGFWILQHLCVGGVQPTVSYVGSKLWNWLTLNELLHVEHHDLSRLSWRHLPRLKELAPELYDGLYHESSVSGLLLSWLRGEKLTADGMDFGCRDAWGCRPGQQMRRNAESESESEDYYAEESDENLCTELLARAGPPGSAPRQRMLTQLTADPQAARRVMNILARRAIAQEAEEERQQQQQPPEPPASNRKDR